MSDNFRHQDQTTTNALQVVNKEPTVTNYVNKHFLIKQGDITMIQ